MDTLQTENDMLKENKPSLTADAGFANDNKSMADMR